MKRYIAAAILFFALPIAAYADMDVEVTINWVPPTENVDGSPLVDLASYTVYYGRSAGVYDVSYVVSDPTQTTDIFTVLGVQDGESIYVVMTAWDDDGNESTYSNEVRFGPFAETDLTSPAWGAGALGGSARVTRCGNDTCTGGN